jgi:hypothetical protein
MNKYLFQISLAGFFLMLVSIMAIVTYVAYNRDSGHVGMDMMKVQKIRQEASKINRA